MSPYFYPRSLVAMLRRVPGAADDLAEFEQAQAAYIAAWHRYRDLGNAAIQRHGPAFRHWLQDKHRILLDQGHLHIHV